MALHHSQDDWLANPSDVQQLKKQLTNVVDYSYIQKEGFSHYDYMLSQNVQELVHDRLISNSARYGHISTEARSRLN